VVEWPSFIEAARENGWWDFQTYDAICVGMEDAGIERPVQAGIKARFQQYVLTHPLAEGAQP
jgi:hypothetical protein